MKNLSRQKFLMEERMCHMVVMKRCLEEYKKTKDKYFLEAVEYLGKVSLQIKKELENL
jgi:hypothetical protein